MGEQGKGQLLAQEKPKMKYHLKIANVEFVDTRKALLVLLAFPLIHWLVIFVGFNERHKWLGDITDGSLC